MSEVDFKYTEKYQVRCESCGTGTPFYDTQQDAAAIARKLCYVAVDDVSGTMNFCAHCKPDVIAEEG